MHAPNTEFAFSFDSDTYRAGSPAQDVTLKYRFATENTDIDNNQTDQNIATNRIYEHNKVRLTTILGRMALERPKITTGIIDDIKQKFSGVVTDINFENNEFTARITDLTDQNNPDELITLSFDEIQETEVQQLTIGDSFIWYIGYVQGRMISREGFSKIRFRHLPSWSQREIEVASNKAEELLHFFTKNTNSPT